MSHLMSTVNPDAVKTIPPEDLPSMGQWLTYRARPGEGRRGRHEFPAMVMARNPVNGPSGLDLLIVYDANDVVYRDSITMESEVQDNSCWVLPSDRDISGQLADLRAELEELKSQVFGEWNPPAAPLGMMDHVVDFEKRVKALEEAAKPKRNHKR